MWSRDQSGWRQRSTNVKHVTFQCHTCDSSMSHMRQFNVTRDISMSHTWQFTVTHDISMSHMRHFNVTHATVQCHTCDISMSHTWQFTVTHVTFQCHTCDRTLTCTLHRRTGHSVLKTVTVTKVFILRFLLKDRKRITESFTYIQRSPG